MTAIMNGLRQTTLTERFRSIPLPLCSPSDKDRSGRIVEELTPYFITPRADRISFIARMDEELGIRELGPDQMRLPWIAQVVDAIRKGGNDCFWLLEKSEKSRMFFEDEFRTGDFTSEEYDDGVIAIAYHPEEDLFYSSSVFLEAVLGYLRGIGPEEMQNDSREMYPIRTAPAYAANLDSVLSMYSAHRGIDIIHRILHARTLTVTGPDGKTAVLARPGFMPVFRKLFSSDIFMDTGLPQTEADGEYLLDFREKDGSRISLRWRNDRLYFGEGEFYELGPAAKLLTERLEKTMLARHCRNRAVRTVKTMSREKKD